MKQEVDMERKIKSPEIELKITEFQGMETADPDESPRKCDV